MKGVLGVFTGADCLADKLGPIPHDPLPKTKYDMRWMLQPDSVAAPAYAPAPAYVPPPVYTPPPAPPLMRRG